MAKDKAAPVNFEDTGDSALVDLDDVDDVVFEALPRGQYEVRLANLTYDISQASGKSRGVRPLSLKEAREPRQLSPAEGGCHVVVAIHPPERVGVVVTILKWGPSLPKRPKLSTLGE